MFGKFKLTKNYLILLCIALFCLCWQTVIAAENANPIYSIRINDATIKRGYEINGFGGNFQITIFPFVLNAPTRIEMKNRTEIARIEDADKLTAAGNEDSANAIDNISTTTIDVFTGADAINRVSTTTVDIIASSTEQLEIENNSSSTPLLIGKNPEGWEINSDIYEFDVSDKNAFNGKKPFVIAIKYTNGTSNQQKIFYYNGGKNEWISLPSTLIAKDKSIRAVIQLPYAKLAVFKSKKILETGSASWYKYKGCNCAASPDYPKGTKLAVTNLFNNKSVIVEVNDYGPDREVFPERVVDLDLEAFTKISKKGVGVIEVKVEPLDEICSFAFEKAKHPQSPAPEISAPMAVLIDEPTGEILYAKNEKEKTPIASITKLMTASVFMDLNPPLPPLVKGGKLEESAKGENIESWNKIITYDKEDDLDGAKLYVNDGETMTIKDIFYSMLVGSANNAAKTLAKNSGVNYEEFIRMMNEKSEKWNLKDTIFYDPSGLNKENKSTAFDLAIMAKNIFKNLEMLKATTLEKYSFRTLNTNIAHTISSTNKLLSDKELYITGAKTGFLNEAGHCLVLKAKNKNDGREVIAVVLGGDSSDTRFLDMKNLIKWALY